MYTKAKYLWLIFNRLKTLNGINDVAFTWCRSTRILTMVSFFCSQFANNNQSHRFAFLRHPIERIQKRELPQQQIILTENEFSNEMMNSSLLQNNAIIKLKYSKLYFIMST